MSLEVISKVLSPTNATYINGVSAERRFSTAVLENMYQGLVEKGGRGINDKFVSESDATESAQVFVNRVLPVKMKPREQGANKNGASFSANQHYTQTVTVGIELLQVLDDPIIIPRARQDMIKVDLLAEQTKIYSDRLRTIINGATFASKVGASWLSQVNGKGINYVVLDQTQGRILDQFISGNDLLDEGDSENGIDIFPEDTRVCVIKTGYRSILKTAGVLVIGGANYAYDIAKGDAISQGATARKTEDGYIGDIDGVPCHVISNESLTHADGFLGFEDGTLKASPLIGYIASSYANARGVSTAKQIKVIDARGGQGLELQPYTKFGVKCFYPKGNVLLAKEEGFNPFASLKELFGTKWSSIVTKIKGAGSRLFPAISLAAPAVGATSVTLSVTALDDWNTSHVVAGYYKVGTKALSTLSEFIAEEGAVEEGALTVSDFEISGLTLDDATLSGQYVSVLAIADDGSVSVKSVKVVG